jgi:alpha-ketoglutarate-dependent taurine dioxygenase|tara:strand:- start:1603 stop:2367 length:765 start_codon:yes stop_codon:yes gene_type:complete
LSIRDFGIARINNVPVVPGTVAEVAQRFGVVHRNNYGEVFDVKTNAYMALGSNSGKYLGPHTDESYRHAAPGITFFHCLAPSAGGGGASILVDGFNAAERLRNSAPDLFTTLTDVPVFFQRRALPEEDMQSHRRMIALDIDGDIEGIRFTDRTLPPQDLPDHLMEATYQAIKAFWNIVNADDVQVEYPMESGDLHIFDNQRVLHGRTGFDPAQGERHLQQCSVNRDEFHNTLRTLAARLDHPAQMQTMAGGALG